MSLVFNAAPAPLPLALPFPEMRIRAGLSGFPSPAQDYEGRTLDLNERLIKRPSATFFMQVVNDGDSQVRVIVRDGRVDIDVRLNEELLGRLEGLLGDGDGDASDQTEQVSFERDIAPSR